MFSSLGSYIRLASWFALISLVPALAYWLLSGFLVGARVFFVFLTVGQISAAWIYRADIWKAVKGRRGR